jgi:putative heme transporter
MMKRVMIRWVAIGLGLGGIVFLLSDRLPDPSAISTALGQADRTWLLVAAAAEMISMAMFARQQRRLLTAFGVTMPRHRALALAFSRSAISISVPAGSAVSAAYAFRQFRTDGASKRTAASVMVLSGLLSLFGLALLYLTGLLAAAAMLLHETWREHPALVEAIATMIIAVALVITFLAWPARRTFQEKTPRQIDWPRLLKPVVDAVRSARDVEGRHWVLALAAATANWLTDLICLAAMARAFHLPVSLVSIGAIYLTVQVVRQIPLTPGGIGVIEVSLIAGLVSAGAADAQATAAVLGYRLLSCWLILPVGLLGALVLRRGTVRSGSTPPAEPAPSHPDTAPAPHQAPPPRLSTAAHG